MKAAALLLVVLMASPALASTPVTLKSEMVDTDGTVTLGEIFEGAGAAVAGRDVSAPQVIKSNDVISLVFNDAGITLTLQARATSGGAVGDTISVQNVSSKKTIQAVVAGPGQAVVGPAADQMKLSRSTRYALR